MNRERRTQGMRWGFEPICAVLQISPATVRSAIARPTCDRKIADELGLPEAGGEVQVGGVGGKATARPVKVKSWRVAETDLPATTIDALELSDRTSGIQGLLGSDGAALIFGIVLAIIVGSVVVGGIKSIGAVTSKLVPAMAIIYVLASLTVIGVNITAVPDAVVAIVQGAFTPEAGFGGLIGVLIVGFQRAAFSNEAGIGSAPIAHSAVRTQHPATEGLVALLEPFIDTVIICTMTALTIVIAQPQLWVEGQKAVLAGGEEPDGVTVTSEAFASVLPWFPYVLTVAVVLFAVSTIITWGYYGQRAWLFLFGNNSVSRNIYNVVFCLFVIIGSVLSLSSVMDFTDAVLFLLALFNIIGLYIMIPVVKRELAAYKAKIRSGEVRKVDEKTGV